MARSHRLLAADLAAIVDRFNLRRVYSLLGLASLVGVVGGLGALVFKWLTDQIGGLFWSGLVGFVPDGPGGETGAQHLGGVPVWWGIVLAPALGGLAAGAIVYRFAPEAAGHGTDAAIRAFHRERGRIRWHIPLVKLVASALTIGSGGSAGREGPIAQIGAGFGSVLGGLLGLSDRQRRMLLAIGIASGIGAIFRAPFAGAIFAAEVLYREPDIEAEVVVPALLSSIVSYTVYCAVHGFGHLFTGTGGFTFEQPIELSGYAVLGIAVAIVGIVYVKTLDRVTRYFTGLRITNYVKPAIGGLGVGLVGLACYALLRDTQVLAVMGAGYGTLQHAVSERGAAGPGLELLCVIAIAKIATTSLTIGSGGSGGVFGPSMVIGGCVGAAVGSVLHAWVPELAPDIGPFAIVGMAGFFAGVAKTPISTLLMVGELTGNYSLLLPSMLVVGLSMLVAHRWTIYPEQVDTRTSSPAHRDELLFDVLAELPVRDVVIAGLRTVTPQTTARELLRVADESQQRSVAVVETGGRLRGVVVSEFARAVVAADPTPGLVVAEDLLAPGLPHLRGEESLQRAVDLLATRHVDQLPVIADSGGFLGMLDAPSVLGAYRKRIADIEHARQGGRSKTRREP
jgi:CIC family chloride channel protein|nr:chloride channel protein [Kofleriaceae bacterium]